MTKRLGWIVGVGLLALLVAPGFVELARISYRQYELDRQLEALRIERERLLAQRARLQNDPIYVEGLIRSTFKQARKDELVITLDPPGASSGPRVHVSTTASSR